MRAKEQKRKNRIDKARCIVTYLDSGLIEKQHIDVLVDAADRLIDGKAMTFIQNQTWSWYNTNRTKSPVIVYDVKGFWKD